MKLMIDLPQKIEDKMREEAAKADMPIQDYALKLIMEHLASQCAA